ALAAGQLSGARYGRHCHGLAGHGADLRAAGHRALFHQRRLAARLHARDGRRHSLRDAGHRSQSLGRCDLWPARSEGEVRLMASIAAAPSPAREIKGRSLWQDAQRRLLANRAAVVSMIILAIIAFLSIVMPFVWPHEFDQVYIDRIS